MMANSSMALNAICPYFTMFPLSFPLGVLKRRRARAGWVLDPFAGRGTTSYAARLLGLPSIGIDSSPVAVALSQAKLANTTPGEVCALADALLRDSPEPRAVPSGEFWSLAFEDKVLVDLCRLREALIADSGSDAPRALRGILMGALHGPRTKRSPSHLSNQCPRTYAPKPAYAVSFWRSHNMTPPAVDVREVIRIRAERYYSHQPPALGTVIRGDSRKPASFCDLPRTVGSVVTSPPYYGMRTYMPDQWLRHWFVGGPAHVDYANDGQLDHPSPEDFATQLKSVWNNVADVTLTDATMVVRFGGIGDRSADPLGILKESFKDSRWRLQTVVSAGSADFGKRQAAHFAAVRPRARAEFDAWCRLV